MLNNAGLTLESVDVIAKMIIQMQAIERIFCGAVYCVVQDESKKKLLCGRILKCDQWSSTTKWCCLSCYTTWV